MVAESTSPQSLSRCRTQSPETVKDSFFLSRLPSLRCGHYLAQASGELVLCLLLLPFGRGTGICFYCLCFWRKKCLIVGWVITHKPCNVLGVWSISCKVTFRALRPAPLRNKHITHGRCFGASKTWALRTVFKVCDCRLEGSIWNCFLRWLSIGQWLLSRYWLPWILMSRAVVSAENQLPWSVDLSGP